LNEGAARVMLVVLRPYRLGLSGERLEKPTHSW